MKKMLTMKDLLQNSKVTKEIKFEDIIAAGESLMRLSARELPASLSYKISRIRKIYVEQSGVFTEKRKAIQDQFGKPNPESEGAYIYEGTGEQDAEDAVNLMLQDMVTCEFYPICLTEFEGMNIEPKIFEHMDCFLELE